MTGGEKIKILIIDDDEIVLEVTSAGLEVNGFETFTAIDGAAGMKKIEENMPDMVLLDLRLPDMDGFEVLRLIKAKPENSNMHVIMITGDRTIDIDKAFALGADDCIIKPIDMNFLVSRIAKLTRKKYRVVAVEDDRQMSEMLRNILEKQGYEVLLFNEGSNLLAEMKKQRPDVALLDISLPSGPDGIEICRSIKNDPETKHIPVIMLTGNDNTGSVDKSFSFGADDYLFKPFNVTELIAKMKKYIRISSRNQ